MSGFIFNKRLDGFQKYLAVAVFLKDITETDTKGLFVEDIFRHMMCSGGYFQQQDELK